MSRKSQNEARHEPGPWDIPAWARDNMVLRFLDDQGLRLETIYDTKYLNGLCNRPLIVIRGKGAPKQTRLTK